MSLGEVDTLNLMVEKLENLFNESQDYYETFLDTNNLFKEGKLTEEQAEIVGQLRDILQREPGIRTEKLNEFIMGIYYKMSGDITKSLTMLNAKDMKDIMPS